MLRAVLYSVLVWAVEAHVPKARFVNEIDIPELVQRLDNLTATVNQLKLKQDQQPIAFKADLYYSQRSSINQRIIFDVVQLNLGNAYHRLLGAFFAPVHGSYLLSISICSNNHSIVLDLMRNKDMIGRVMAGDKSTIDCSSQTTVSELFAGDEVYIQCHQGDLISAAWPVLNSFTGALLQPL
ncbi:heavy metal-binding protein HIP-like [Dreissena polymorpha]|uniref:C1q domain-containing protein n=1 Tax=Dreissena polymorpha TaxID=45954 RepID=A0A9D4I9R5_DREPO|nr:heavy metal-binding protein HIP-like [Dreissena polymorpha]KAH3755036.1 hypothetical protein DPMN_189717 [Dreissena polymorpha]